MILTAALNIFGTSFIAIMPVYARDVLRAGAGGYGALMSFFGIGAAAGRLSVAAVGPPVPPGAHGGSGGTGPGRRSRPVGLVPFLGLALGLVLGAGLSMALNSIMTNTLLQTEAPDHLRGQVMGFYSFIVVGMSPFGSLQAGWIAEHAGTGVALWIGGSGCFSLPGPLPGA